MHAAAFSHLMLPFCSCGAIAGEDGAFPTVIDLTHAEDTAAPELEGTIESETPPSRSSKGSKEAAGSSLAGRFSLRLDTQGEPLGVGFDVVTTGLLIRSVDCGPMRTHNVCSPSRTNLFAYDVVVKVNTHRDAVGMAQSLEYSSKLSLDAIHPEHFALQIDARNEPLGLELVCHSGAQKDLPPVFEITGILPGAVQAYNDHIVAVEKARELDPLDYACSKDVPAGTKMDTIQLSDLIVEVNGVSTDAVQMESMLMDCGVVDLKLLRLQAESENEAPEEQSAERTKLFALGSSARWLTGLQLSARAALAPLKNLRSLSERGAEVKKEGF